MDLYDAALLALAARPGDFPEAPTHVGEARSPLCGDAVEVGLVCVDDRVVEAGWRGQGCAVCRASASALCAGLIGASADGTRLREALEASLAGHRPEGPFSALAAWPARHGCARLPFLALDEALVPSTGEPVVRGEGLPTDPWAAALHFRARGLEVALGTLVEVVGSSPMPLGSTLVVASNGEFWGAVSGGCVESAVVRAGLALLRSGEVPAVHRFQIANSQVGAVGLPCGGQVRIHVGRAPSDAVLRDYRVRGSGRARVIDLGRHTEGVATDAATEAHLDGSRFVQPLARKPRLVLVGGTHIAQHLVSLAASVGFEPVVVEPRSAFAGPGRFACEVVVDRPERALPVWVDRDTAVVMLTHDAVLDDPGLVAALGSEAFYVGALGSRKTQRERLGRLAAVGVSSERLARLHGPAGLAIGALGAGEIALSILAEVVAVRRRVVRLAVGGVVLAAGRSTRAGAANKLLHPIAGVPMVRHAVQHVLSAGVSPVVVVLGHEADAVRAVLEDLPVAFVHNPDFACGMGTSVAAGVAALAERDVSAALIALGDMPWIRPNDLRRLVDTHTPGTAHLVVVPVAGAGQRRRRGNPVLWPRRSFGGLMALTGDRGGRDLLAAEPGTVLEVPVDDVGVLQDLDVLPVAGAAPGRDDAVGE